MVRWHVLAICIACVLLGCSDDPPSDVSTTSPDTQVPTAIISTAPAPTQPPAEPPAAPKPILAYEILKDRSDMQSGYQDHVRLDILIKGSPLTKANVEALIQQIYDEQKTRIQNDAPLWTVWIWAYTSREHAKAGQWAAMFGEGNQLDRSLVFEDRLFDAPKVKRAFSKGSIDEEKSLFDQIVRIEDRAQREATAEYPLDDESNFDKEQALEQELNDRYKSEFRRSHHLSKKDLENIGDDGLRFDWPLPTAEDE